MCIGYDPFRWADNYESEDEYLKELINEERKKENERRNKPSSRPDVRS